ncbi:MAG: GNAT family N-acetyltransferase [Chloroflexi bacterium]|nr:GNAT family N-acetyltransferase [Chloroflexota bacterium]
MLPIPDTSDRNLLEIDVATLFVLTEGGRIQHVNDPPQSPGPRLYLGGCGSGNVVCIRHDVGKATAQAISTLASDEAPLRELDSVPIHLDDYIRLLASEVPVERWSVGLTYCFPGHLQYDHNVTLVTSGTPEGDRFLTNQAADQGMQQTLAALGFSGVSDLWAPWCIALYQGEIASIGITARLGAEGAEAGVITVPVLRGRGFAAAAAAGWAVHPLLRGRALFYSTDHANVSSQRVAARLGLPFLGASLRIT